MPGHSTIAARCAALSSAIAQIITDASSFARQVRTSRHDISAVNANLIAIKLSLDIARDDFSASGVGFPILLLEAASGFLDCCSTATEELHKLVVRLSAIALRNQSWHIVKDGDLAAIRQDLEAVRSALDLVLDLVTLFNDSDDEHSSSSPVQKCMFGDHGLEVEHSLLRRIDIEREHVESLTEGRLPTLYTSFDRLRACTAFYLEERNAASEEPQKRSDSRSDSLDPATGDSPRSGRKSPSPLPDSASNSNGIGAWIANVVSQIVHSPAFPPESIRLSDPRLSSIAKSSEESVPSRGPSQLTFYAESTTSGSRTQSSGKAKAAKSKTRARVDSPQLVVKLPKSKFNKTTHYTTSTILSSDERSIFEQKITCDKLAIAKDKRKRLTRDQRVAIDWDLRNISPISAPGNVERIFFEGANPNVEDPEFGFFLIRAAYELSTAVLKLLVQYGADINRTTSTPYYSAVHAAVLGNQLENLQYLVSLSPSSIEAPNANGETPLHLAVKTPGAYDIARWLLDMGADVNREAPEAGAPLHIAVAKLENRERSAMVELLLAHGAEGEVSAEAPERRGKGLSVLGLI